MADNIPKRVALAVSKFQVGVIRWPTDKPVALTGGKNDENAVVVYRQLAVTGADWQPLTKKQIESELNESLPHKEGSVHWKVRDIDMIIIFLSSEALHGHESESKIAPIEKGLLWEFPISKVIYLTSDARDTVRMWLKTFNHDHARVIRVSDEDAPMTMMRLIEEFIGKGEIEERK
jgi:hypothetical protein